jgi:hypothetical protein
MLNKKHKWQVVLCFISTSWRYMGHGGKAVWIPNLGTRWRLVTASHSGCFISRETAPYNNWTEGWMGPRASLQIVVKREIPFSAENWTLVIQHIATLLTALSAYLWMLNDNQIDLETCIFWVSQDMQVYWNFVRLVMCCTGFIGSTSIALRENLHIIL